MNKLSTKRFGGGGGGCFSIKIGLKQVFFIKFFEFGHVLGNSIANRFLGASIFHENFDLM